MTSVVLVLLTVALAITAIWVRALHAAVRAPIVTPELDDFRKRLAVIEARTSDDGPFALKRRKVTP